MVFLKMPVKKKKKVKKKTKISRPPSLTIRLSKEDMGRVREAVKKIGVKSAAAFAKTALLEKVNSILSEEKPAETTST